MFLATYGIVITIIVLFFMYINGGVIIKSMFKYVIGPFISNTRNSFGKETSPSSSMTNSDEIMDRVLKITASQTKVMENLSETMKQVQAGKQSIGSPSGVEIVYQQTVDAILDETDGQTPKKKISQSESHTKEIGDINEISNAVELDKQKIEIITSRNKGQGDGNDSEDSEIVVIKKCEIIAD